VRPEPIWKQVAEAILPAFLDGKDALTYKEMAALAFPGFPPRDRERLVSPHLAAINKYLNEHGLSTNLVVEAYFEPRVSPVSTEDANKYIAHGFRKKAYGIRLAMENNDVIYTRRFEIDAAVTKGKVAAFSRRGDLGTRTGVLDPRVAHSELMGVLPAASLPRPSSVRSLPARRRPDDDPLVGARV
jgi:hypothetical protein